MTQRIDAMAVAPDAVRTFHDMERYLRGSGLESSLVHLVKLRASQMNGCAYCVDMHTKDARAAGESEQRLYATSVWREAPFFSARERAALAWTEAVTDVAASGVGDELYDLVRQHFEVKEVVDLTLAVVAINAWNRMAISFRPPVGSYVPPAAAAAARN